MQSQELIDRFLEFFRQRGHAILPAAPLTPQNDPTVLFTAAGMHPLVPYLLGLAHPQGRRLAALQPCVRTTDIDAVGDATHLTLFEMLGNWSLGDYFKSEAITWSWEFLTGAVGLRLRPERLAVSIFSGDRDAPRDVEAEAIWRRLGVRPKRIAALGKADNWWGPAGQTGPCGPDTEMFYWIGLDPAPATFDPRDARWVEIWNDVFMQYRKTETGTFVPLAQKNVDTGLGVERTVAALNGVADVFATDAFTRALAVIRRLAPAASVSPPVRIIADHLRAATMILGGDNPVVPSNVERGYVVRRLIRQAAHVGHQLGLTSPFTATVAAAYVETLQARYPELTRHAAFIAQQLTTEEEKFMAALAKGERELKRLMARLGHGPHQLAGRVAFDLFQTHGFPLEVTAAILKADGWTVDRSGFQVALTRHQEQSKTAAAGRFRSGLADTSAASTRLHTATHLLHAALRQVLGNHVQQRGSNITPERLRFDFSHPSRVSAADLRQVEALVNEHIARAWPVRHEEMSPQAATRQGALGFFGHKYAATITVYTIGDFSQEICTGPHVRNTAELGGFRILKEEAAAAGIRRIKATVHPPATASPVTPTAKRLGQAEG